MQLQINNMNFSNLIWNLIITAFFVGMLLSYLFIPPANLSTYLESNIEKYCHTTGLSTELTEADNKRALAISTANATKAIVKAIVPSIDNI